MDSKILKSIMLMAMTLFLASCLQVEKAETVLTIKKDGKGSLEINFYNITSDSNGKSAIEEIAKLHKAVKNNKGLELNKKYTIKNYKESLIKTKSGKLNGKATGELSSILETVRLIFHDRDSLVDARNFSVEWKNEVLTIKLSDRKTSKRPMPSKNDGRHIFIVKTEGKFLPGTKGKLSADRKETQINIDKPGDILLVIGDLVDKP